MAQAQRAGGVSERTHTHDLFCPCVVIVVTGVRRGREERMGESQWFDGKCLGATVVGLTV